MKLSGVVQYLHSMVNIENTLLLLNMSANPIKPSKDETFSSVCLLKEFYYSSGYQNNVKWISTSGNTISRTPDFATKMPKLVIIQLTLCSS